MNYPLISEYIEAIKAAEDNFKELANLRPVLGDDGQPVMTSGNFAVVFKMQDVETGNFYALKCFTKEQEGRGEAYKQISHELEKVFSNYVTKIRYYEKELIVDTKFSNEKGTAEFPVLLMKWVEGKPLCTYLQDNCGDIILLEKLCFNFSVFSYWLLNQPFAHGDIQSDNILIKKDGSIVLVDYDGMYVPAMKGQSARELGSPDFRHPLRFEKNFDKQIDDFPLLLILMSLKAISIKPELIGKYCANGTMLFSREDFVNFGFSTAFTDLQDMLDNKELCRLFGAFITVYADRTIKSVSLNSIILENPSPIIPSEEGIIDQGWKYLAKSQEVLADDIFLCGPQRTEEQLFKQNEIRSLSKKYKEKAFQCFLKVAKQGNAKAQYALGVYFDIYCYDNPAPELAYEYYLIAAEHGYPPAQEMVGRIFYSGYHKVYNRFPFNLWGTDTIPINSKNALLWYSLAAEQGDANALYSLGNCYIKGGVVSQSYDKAIDLFTKAAEQANSRAQVTLGDCYAEGKGVPMDWKKAVLWYTKAAEQGEDEGMDKLALCYEKGLGVPRDMNKAKEWRAKISFEYR